MVHETIQSMKYSKNIGMLVKLDIVKAYDKLNWKYMRYVRALWFQKRMD